MRPWSLDGPRQVRQQVAELRYWCRRCCSWNQQNQTRAVVALVVGVTVAFLAVISRWLLWTTSPVVWSSSSKPHPLVSTTATTTNPQQNSNQYNHHEPALQFSPHSLPFREHVWLSANRTVCGQCHGGRLWETDYILDIFEARACVHVCQPDSVAFVGQGLKRLMEQQVDFQIRNGGYLPRILLDVSGEHCHPPRHWSVYDAFDLVLRHYACWHQYRHLYARYPHVTPVPLGYTNGFLRRRERDDNDDDNNTTPRAVAALDVLAQVEAQTLGTTAPPRRRNLTWAFIGHVWGDERELMLAEFADLVPNTHGEANVALVHDIYLDAAFVLAGRGHVNLDCFRQYEASISGAIPVVVGSTRELRDTFGTHRAAALAVGPPQGSVELPRGWVFADSWPEAKRVVQQLLENNGNDDNEEIRKRQMDTIHWMRDEFLRMQRAIRSVPNIVSPLSVTFDSREWHFRCVWGLYDLRLGFQCAREAILYWWHGG